MTDLRNTDRTPLTERRCCVCGQAVAGEPEYPPISELDTELWRIHNKGRVAAESKDWVAAAAALAEYRALAEAAA